MSKTEALLSLKLVAAKSEKLAYDLEHNKLWEGDLEKGIASIRAALNDAERAAR